MASNRYQVVAPTVVSRAHINGGGETVVTYLPRPDRPTFESRRAAAVEYMRTLDVELAAAPDDFVMLHWRAWQRRGYAKIVVL